MEKNILKKKMHKMRRLFLVFICKYLLLLNKCRADDILGCGGFIQSHVPLDFSKIEIGLYSKGGILKEKTECAPTNGYYFLPSYEKGEYVLKVHPPAGWSFEPSEVELVVDGVTDLCSLGQDINFSFNGFGIAGRVVTAGQKQGPSGIAVQLINEKGDIRNTQTSKGGDFHFTPVIPGKYTIKASHPRWKLDPGQAIVQVKEGNTALPVGVLAVKGYDVKGSISSFKNPIAGVYVLLYPKGGSPKFRVEGCNTALLQGVPDAPICHSITDASGEFSFGIIPAGEYKLVALAKTPGQVSLTYNLRPDFVPITVKHDSLYIKEAFEITGFNIVGSVLTGSGTGVSGARVLLDDAPVSITDKEGEFTLPQLQPGTFALTATHEQCQFEPIQLRLTSSGAATLASLIVARWRVCGEVAGGRGARVLKLKGVGAPIQADSDALGKWCVFLAPGVYRASVEVLPEEQREGLQFFPIDQKISVGHGPVDNINFSQLKGKVVGKVKCLRPKDCDKLTVTLRSQSEGGQGVTLTSEVKGDSYSFSEVIPGMIHVSVSQSRFCWQSLQHSDVITKELLEMETFEQTAYKLEATSKHDIEVDYQSKSHKGTLQVSAGISWHCLPSAEQYTLTPKGCQKFKPEKNIVNMDSENPTVEFVAVSYSTVIKLSSLESVDDLTLTIETEKGNKVIKLQPKKVGAQYSYEHTLYMADGEVVTVIPSSSSLLFHPQGPQKVFGKAECQPLALLIKCSKGITLSGKIVPAVAGALITLNGGDVIQTLTTTSDGTYKFGPLDASKQYSVTAGKESYVFTNEPNGDIIAKKLAEIHISVVDEADNVPLQGAVVSVSGGSYRRTQASGPTGTLHFTSLTPQQYYIKPHLTEYSFTPPHHLLPVDTTLQKIVLRGKRVAWSIFGSVLSASGTAWQNVAVEATSDCHSLQAVTDIDGSFRIRGLVPECTYKLQLKETDVPELQGLKIVKSPDTLQVTDKKDIENVVLIVIQSQQITDASVLVYTPNVDHYKSLRLSLAAENTPHTHIYTTKLDPIGFNQYLNPGLVYVLPRLQADNKTYVVKIESTLSKSTHSYDEQAFYFTSDGSYKHFAIDFLPKVKSSDQELKHTPIGVVPLIIAGAVAYWQRDRIAATLNNRK